MSNTTASHAAARTLPAIIAPELSNEGSKVTTTSTQVAQHFGKRHADVIRAIRNLGAEIPTEVYERNFAFIQKTTYLGNGRTRQDPVCNITRDGFTLLAMGFTGKDALLWKLAYIEAFNRMEAELQKPAHDPERLRLAHSLSVEVAAVASRAVFDAVMAGDQEWKHDRWMFCLNYGKDNKRSEPWAKAIDRKANVMSLERLAKAIVEPGGMLPSDVELANLAAACNKRLAGNLEYQASRKQSDQPKSRITA